MKPQETLTLTRDGVETFSVTVRAAWSELAEIAVPHGAGLALWVRDHDHAPDARIDWRLTAAIDCLTEDEPTVETSTYVDSDGESRTGSLVRVDSRNEATTWRLEARIAGNATTLDVKLLARATDPLDTSIAVGSAAG